jgi:hypothetical protein
MPGGPMTVTNVAPTPVGSKVYFVGHSFHMFIVRPLIYLAKEAGIPGHWAEGWDMIGGSTPMQHWERGGGDNEVKQALRTGRVEVLTLSSNVIVPEPAIDLFADLAVAHNPDVRVMVQHSWGDASTGAIMMARHGRAAEPAAGTVGTNEDRDHATADDLARMRGGIGETLGRLRDQLDGIDARHGRPVTSVVPAGEAVVRLREAVLAGELPGVSRQSELFRDPLGHASQPTMDVVTYLWFAALYQLPLDGLTTLVDAADPTSAERQQVLQRIAIETLADEPRSGFPPAAGPPATEASVAAP